MALSDERRAAPAVPVLMNTLEEGYRGPCWHGPSLRAVLRQVGIQAAQLRLQGEGNSIWEIVLHLAYTRHRALLHISKFSNTVPERFPRKLRKSWWPELPSSRTQESWDSDKRLLDSYHHQLLRALADTSQDILSRHRFKKPWPLGAELLGVATHDAYHGGQIRLIARAATEAE